jgi:hypothetical protein
LCDVLMYVSAQYLDFLELVKKYLVYELETAYRLKIKWNHLLIHSKNVETGSCPP